MVAVAGLDEGELATWIRDARAHDLLCRARTVSLAVRLAEGSLGRGLWGRRDARLSRRLLGGVDRYVASFVRQLQAQAVVRREADPDWPRVEDRLQVVDTAWEWVVQRWLEPAVQRRAWHADPYSGLALFLAASELSALVGSTSRPAGVPPVLASLEVLTTVERAVARLLVAGERHDDDAIDWEEHPTEVTVPAWRAELGEGLRAAARLSGSPVSATFDAVAEVVGEHPARGAVLRVGRSAPRCCRRRRTWPCSSLHGSPSPGSGPGGRSCATDGAISSRTLRTLRTRVACVRG